jgi:hypothetical protein
MYDGGDPPGTKHVAVREGAVGDFGPHETDQVKIAFLERALQQYAMG